MNRYEVKQEARRARLEARADRLRTEGQSRVRRGDEALKAIPFGQPILVGHYSEKGDRAYRARATNNLRKGFEAINAAAEVERRAEAVGAGGISSDDPDAVTKLRQQLSQLEALQARMTEANKLVRRFKNDVPAGVEALIKSGIPAGRAPQLFEPDFAGRLGFPGYALTNNGANVRRIKARIEQLQRNARREDKETVHASGVRVVENAEENRLQLFFPGKPPVEVRTALKATGFRWAPSEGAWQRQLGNSARWAAEHVLSKLTSPNEIDTGEAVGN